MLTFTAKTVRLASARKWLQPRLVSRRSTIGMTLKTRKPHSNKAISPAVSTVIITGTMVALISVALAFAGNFLTLRIAESEFNSSKQFMQTLGLEIDDVAWIIGRTETARYSGKYGAVTIKAALNYTIYVNTTTQLNQKLYSNVTNIICFNLPVDYYSIGNNYFELVYPSSDAGFLYSGASAPLARVFAVEKLPMTDGSFIRAVTAPAIRTMNLTIGETDYLRLYLPILAEGESPRLSQSVTLTGESVSKIAQKVTGIRVEVSFPLSGFGFDNFFFNFPQTSESLTLSGETILELYVGGVDVASGVHA